MMTMACTSLASRLLLACAMGVSLRAAGLAAKGLDTAVFMCLLLCGYCPDGQGKGADVAAVCALPCVCFAGVFEAAQFALPQFAAAGFGGVVEGIDADAVRRLFFYGDEDEAGRPVSCGAVVAFAVKGVLDVVAVVGAGFGEGGGG
nr:MAG TPA: hypothetical protein [Caudoviricetes sp.]